MSEQDKRYIPDGLTRFPKFTRIHEDDWATVGKDGTVVCPDNCGAWTGFVRWEPELGQYVMYAGWAPDTLPKGKRGQAVRPYLRWTDVSKAILDADRLITTLMADKKVLEELLLLWLV